MNVNVSIQNVLFCLGLHIRRHCFFLQSWTQHEHTDCVITLRANISKCGRRTFWILLIWTNRFPVTMSDQAGYSPSFKRPSEIMRMRMKRARLSTSGRDSAESPGQSDPSPSGVRPFSPGPLFSTLNRTGGGIKRRNPFANIENTYSPKKKLVIYNDDGNVEAVDLNQIKASSEKEGDRDMSTRTDCQIFSPLSSRLTEAEKWEDKGVSRKVCAV